ncbi:Putative transcriptional regulator, LysR family [Vibrio nigripulchritudo SFn27]|uniref:Putative transcriptional regulator, LysR family n=1 Tax=Vibrio nigripulchritudo TaxID=28173 RepID=U4KC10_9VIBR|nr:LysR family transcriptional regulator [Vibrio nigripulchritudo]CCN85381.1 Putative transcriptional regulator, LysR family [Vibrio nigripulchritudo BLFn1]CCN89089.1 Putative transcriptional regulator, LysR family [Vibrio nigripulchritudo SFn27]CCN95125.1 Putative transcriptional regulator, LysR family [Vibrio nigripulchritudo ENn2]CCO41787.1 Putative transcriptional regulator, LysR family [Vibrio nigripulchritudo SFn135]CCO50894.1 Putative transcriptional regulator, LysR family [Vibrio nigri
MELEDIYRRDLNLLVALRVIIEEGSVSRAAERLNLSQSAMSRVLGRLRDMVGDPLFIRQGQHLMPTEKALTLNQSLNEPLEALRSLLTPEEFDPETCDQTFTIATTDYAMQTILPFALPRIYQEAPQVKFEFIPLLHDQLPQQLTHHGADLAICRPIGLVEPLNSDVLGRVGVSCLVSKHHPIADQKMTLTDYLQYPHAMIAISDGVKALLDQALVDQPSRNMVLRAYHLEAALAIVDTLPLIITVPADLAYLVAERYDLVVKPLPFEFTPFEYSMIWHPRCEHSPAQEWLRAVVKQECSKLIAKRVEDLGLDNKSS